MLWVGTQVGLNRLESPDMSTFRHYFERDGLASDTIYGIRPDAREHLWISTGSGLLRFDPRSETFKSYNASHGLQSNEFNYGAHLRSRTGELLFGGVNGFNAFDPERVESNSHVPPVVLTSFTKLNQPVPLGAGASAVGEIALSYSDFFTSFEFAALDFTAPEENRYRYQLQGLTDDWVGLGGERRVSFAHLEPGSYMLRV